MNPRSAIPTHPGAVVVGGGIAGLVSAWELARAGVRPLLVEARGYLGGLIARGTVGGANVDLGAETYVVRGTDTSSIVDALGLTSVEPAGSGARLYAPALRGGWELRPFLRDSFLGIPAHPDAPDCVHVLGEAGVCRALEDRSMGGGVGMDEAGETLAGFVAARMGEAVLERSVRPIIAGIYTADPSVLATDTVAPCLRAETARHGSLAAAVAARLAAAGSRRTPEACVEGGMFVLVDALKAAIEEAGGTVLTRTGAFSLRRAASGWTLECGPTKPGPTPGAEPVPSGPGVNVTTERLVLACSASAALRLLTQARIPGLVPDVSVPEGAPIARLTLAVHAPELDDAPVSQGLLVAPATADERPVAAKALSHLTIKWPWLADQLPPHTHLLRLSYGRLGEAEPASPSMGPCATSARSPASPSPPRPSPTTCSPAGMARSRPCHPSIAAASPRLTNRCVPWAVWLSRAPGSPEPASPPSSHMPARARKDCYDHAGIRSGNQGIAPGARPIHHRRAGDRGGRGSARRGRARQSGGRAHARRRVRRTPGCARRSRRVRRAAAARPPWGRVRPGRPLLQGPAHRPHAGAAHRAVLQREDPRDALCAADGATLSSLPESALVGTGSPRRAAQVLAARPDLRVCDLRGNVPTRLSRVRGIDLGADAGTAPSALGTGERLDAVVLALSGLRRIGLDTHATDVLDPAIMMPAPSQGALAIETRDEEDPSCEPSLAPFTIGRPRSRPVPSAPSSPPWVRGARRRWVRSLGWTRPPRPSCSTRA